MSPRFYIIFAIPFLIYLTGCGRCGGEGKDYCSGNSGLGVEIIGFDSIQVDTIYIIQFSKGSNFKNIVDTLILAGPYSLAPSMVGDTVYISSAPDYEFFQNGIETFYGALVAANYDSEIIIPGQKIIKISNFDLQSAYLCKEDYDRTISPLDPCYCCDIISYQQDGVTMTSQPAVISN